MIAHSFTRHLTEESTGYAKLQENNFRKIRYNEAEKAIMNNEAKAAISGVSVYIKENPELYDESYFKVFNEIKRKRRVETISQQDFDLFYSFSGAIRGDRKYGNSNWSARFLYEFLCTAFNSGERFIDTYFNQLFIIRPVYETLKDLVERVQDSIESRWNDGNLKGGQWGAFYKFQESQMDHLKDSLERFSSEIRDDIINCLSTGMIPLNFSLSSSTVKKRLSLGLPGTTPFYATSWLIKQLEVHIILGSDNSGMLYYSDTYKGK